MPNTKSHVQEPHRPSSTQEAARTLMIISTCLLGFFFIIPLAWCLPITLNYNKKIINGEKISPAFGICAILFMGPIGIAGGICALIDLNDNYKKEN